MSEPSNHSETPLQSQNQPPTARRRLSARVVIALGLLGLALIHAVSWIIAGDERGQLELAVILLVTLFASIAPLTNALSRSRVGQFIRANPSSTTLVKTKRLTVRLDHDTNSFVVVQGFLAVLFILIVVMVLAAAAIRWITS